MVDVYELWDFEDPAGSERRFREAVGLAQGRDRAVLQTQLARALGLRDQFDAGHAILDELLADDGLAGDPEVKVRVALERGRLLRSSGDPKSAGPLFEEAARLAAAAGLTVLQIDALHMVALVSPADAQLAVNVRALALALSAQDPRARSWDASLLNNIGMSFADAGDFEGALALFRAALTARERIGEAQNIRIARWMIGWSLRNLGQTQQALTIQLQLRAEFSASGAEDPYVEEEIAILQAE